MQEARDGGGQAKPQGVEAVERALTLLKAFLPDGQPRSLADLAAATGYYKSTILRLAVSLERFGCLTRRSDGRWLPGPMLGQLGSAWRRGFDLAGLVRPVLADLVRATGESASFYVREGSDRLCLHRINSPHAARHHLEEGTRLPMGLGAVSKVLLAFDGSGGGDAAVRTAGWAESLGERDPLVAAVAVPVLTPSGTLVGGLTVSGLMGRFDDSARAAALTLLRQMRQRIEAAL
jgi:DNA-binding IclR family transcriptional regulator